MIFNKKGFTLLEILITTVIIAIVSVLVIPSYQSFQSMSHHQIISSQLLRAIALAKMKAVELRETTILCKSNNKKTCGGNWLDGYIIRAGNKVLYTFSNPTTKGLLNWRSALKLEYLRFSPHDFSRSVNGTFWYCPDKSLQPTMLVIINKVGRIRQVEGKKLEDMLNKGATYDCTT